MGPAAGDPWRGTPSGGQKRARGYALGLALAGMGPGPGGPRQPARWCRIECRIGVAVERAPRHSGAPILRVQPVIGAVVALGGTR